MTTILDGMISFKLLFNPFKKIRLLEIGAKQRTFLLSSRCPLAAQDKSFQEGCRCICLSAKTLRMWEVPSQKEAEELKATYCDPRRLVHDLLKPLTDSGLTVEPRVVHIPRLRGRFWRVKLHLHWPSKVVIAASHASVTGAEENVYLLACDLLQKMGLLYKHNSGQMKPVNRHHVINILEILHSRDPFSPPPPQFTCVTLPSRTFALTKESIHNRDKSETYFCCQGQSWQTDISAAWPYSFSISAQGSSFHASQYAASLLACSKLKALGLLTRDNQLDECHLQNISRRIRSVQFNNLEKVNTDLCLKDFNPHYEIFSDASAFGFGAYLLNKENNKVHWLTNTWSEHFHHCPEILQYKKYDEVIGRNHSSVYLDINFCELYSVVSACYTWKHKFLGKRVLVWTDNMAVVRFVNCGVQGKTSQQYLGKLFEILTSTVEKYSFHLLVRHLNRTENSAADFLSRQNLEAFRAVMPDASPSQKKVKKLLFWNPLQQTPE